MLWTTASLNKPRTITLSCELGLKNPTWPFSLLWCWMPSGTTSFWLFHFFPVWQTSDYNSPCCEYVKFVCKNVKYIYQYEAIIYFGEWHTSKAKPNSDLHCDSFVLPCLLGTQSGYAGNRFVCVLKTSGKNKCFYGSLFGHKKHRVIGKWGESKMCSFILCIFANDEIKWGRWCRDGRDIQQP